MLAAGVAAATIISTVRAPAFAFELNIAAGADPVSLDPRKTWVAQGYSINVHVFQPLVFREEKDGKVNLVPVLAESWKQLSPTQLEITLRQGVMFQNGEKFDASAVAYTLTSILDPDFKTNMKLWLRNIDKVEVIDPYKIIITTKTQARGLLNVLAQVPIVAPEAAKQPGFEMKPIGTGPYRIVSYAPNSQTVLQKFDGFWGTPGKADKITFKVMPESSTRLAALEAGEVQLAENLPPDKLGSLRANAKLQVVYTPTLRVGFLTMNFRNPLMSNVKFREAISLAIDRQGIVDALLAGTTKIANSISPPGTIGYDASLPPYAYNPEKAKALLKEAGYNGAPITVGGPSGRYAMDKQVTEAIAGMLRAVGINAKVETLAFASYIPKFYEGAYDLGFFGLTDFTISPQQHWPQGGFHGPTSHNKYQNPEMDKIIDDATVELDDAKAAEIFKRGQALQQKEFGGSLPLYYEPQLIGLRADVTGFVPRLDEYIIVSTIEPKK